MFNLDKLLRENIRSLTPYSSARDEFKGEASVFLDANENSYGSPLKTAYNRYPDPRQKRVKEQLSLVKGIPSKNIFLGNGSDEAIDLLFRAFCRPGIDHVITVPPTYGMYEVAARINDIEVKKVKLKANYQLNLSGIDAAINANTKLIFICSPNNPTGNSINREDIETILTNFDGLVVVDEAYINYAKQKSLTYELAKYPNLVVLQTLSKAWGLAGLRLGMAFASEGIIDVLNRIKPPYNISEVSQQLVLNALEQIDQVNLWIKEAVLERELLREALQSLPFIQAVLPSDANFILVKMTDSRSVYMYLAERGIVVRDRSKIELCENCLRITIGTPIENKTLLTALIDFNQ
jgi:histidinol-phosphate aminotransferase